MSKPLYLSFMFLGYFPIYEFAENFGSRERNLCLCLLTLSTRSIDKRVDTEAPRLAIPTDIQSGQTHAAYKLHTKCEICRPSSPFFTTI